MGIERSARAAAVVLIGLVGTACRSTVDIDESEWTVERAVDVITRVERAQVEAARGGAWAWRLDPHGIDVHDESEGVPDPDSAFGLPRCDERGFDDFRLLSLEEIPGAPRGDEYEELDPLARLLADLLIEAMTGEAPPSGSMRARYGIVRVEFADIERVEIARGAYPLFAVLVVIGPWFHDVEVDLADGESLTLYRRGSIGLNLLPVWLVPFHWFVLQESYEYAEAVEFLRRRAAAAGVR